MESSMCTTKVSSWRAQVVSSQQRLPRSGHTCRQRAAAPRSIVCESTKDGEVRLPRDLGDNLKKGCAIGLASLAALTWSPTEGSLADLGLAEAFPQEVVSQLAATVLGEPITNPRLLLRESLPKDLDDHPIIQVENSLLSIGAGNKRSAAGSRSIAQSETLLQQASAVDPQVLSTSLRRANSILKRNSTGILADIPSPKQAAGQELLADMEGRLDQWERQVAGGSGGAADVQRVTDLQNDLLNISSQIQGLLVPAAAVDEMPAEFRDRPQLQGRAVVEMNVRDVSKNKSEVLTVVVDGLNAPVTAGNFVRLVQSRFYDHMPIQRADGFVVQTGEPASPAAAQPVIPMEVRYENERNITYGATKEELRLMRKQVALPFNAHGTLAMARDEFDANSANSQIFFLQKESEVTPSGANVLDGNYAVFGYVVENQDALNVLDVGDVIESARVVYGADNMYYPPSA